MTQHDPNQVAADWAARLSGSTEKIKRGVAGVTTSPGALAARQKDVWAQNTQAAKEKFARNSARLQLQDWQSAMVDKGIARIQTGATGGQPKMAAFLTRFLPYVAQVRSSLPPRGNLDANIARMSANVRALAQFGQQGR